MSDPTFENLTAELRSLGDLLHDRRLRDAVEFAADEIERMRAWKAEAIVVLREWNAVADQVVQRLDWHDTLGLRRSEIVGKEIDHLLELVCVVANERNVAPDRDDKDRVVVSLHRDDYNTLLAAVDG